MARYRTSTVSDPLSDVILAVGSEQFDSRLSETLLKFVQPDIVGAYFINPQVDMRVLFAGGGLPNIPGFPDKASHSYARRFWKDDPALCRLLGRALTPDQSVVVRQHWNEIPRGEYRTFCYEQPNMLERVSVYKSFSQGHILLSLYRRAASGLFSSDELRLIERTADILAAATIRHVMVARAQAILRPNPAVLVAQVRSWQERLSERETEVCAALLRERSVKSATRQLGMQSSTFITYRKRAFAKLGIGTNAELMQLYEQRCSPPQ